MRFSQKMGLSPIRDVLQLESIDEPLTNGLWNLLDVHVWRTFSSGSHGYLDQLYNPHLTIFCSRLWLHYFKEPVDQMPTQFSKTRGEIRARFMQFQWWEVYDFIEFTAQNFEYGKAAAQFRDGCNHVLELEMSAYRFAGTSIVRISDREELDAVSVASADGRTEVVTHLRRAAELMSDRKSPDYRNSIKESISAVESLVILVIGEKGTLGQLLKSLESEISLHPALKQSFSSIYGYTSDQSGIRHALIDGGTDVDFADAKLMLVMCSTFINFVEAKLAVAKRGST